MDDCAGCNFNPLWDSREVIGMEDHWSSDSDTTEDSPMDDAFPQTDEVFRQQLLSIKHALYDELVYDIEDNKQDLQNLQNYLTALNRAYMMIAKGTNEDLPPSVRPAIQVVIARLNVIKPYEERIPYLRTVEAVLHEDPFVQK